MSYLMGPDAPKLTPDDAAKQEKICLQSLPPSSSRFSVGASSLSQRCSQCLSSNRRSTSPIWGIAVMTAKKRRHRSPVVDAEEELLSKGRWSQYKANEALHRPDENHHARRRYRQLIEGHWLGATALSIPRCNKKTRSWRDW